MTRNPRSSRASRHPADGHPPPAPLGPRLGPRPGPRPGPYVGTRDGLGAAPDDGATAVLVALAMTVLLGMAALVVDLGLARDARAQAQNAADAGALAAALTLAGGAEPAEATRTVHAYARTNYGVTPAEWSACQDPAPLPEPLSACISRDTAERVVRVVIPRRTLPTLFAGVLTDEAIRVGAAAEAEWDTRAGDCLLCVMDDLEGQVGSLTVDGGDVAVNGDLAFNNANGGITVAGGGIGYTGTWNGEGTFSPAPLRRPAAPDPLADLVLPPAGVDPGAAATEGAGACVPGNYTTVDGCTSFASGLYVLAGERTTVHDAVAATGVTLYFTCARDEGRTTYPRACGAGGEEGAVLAGAGNGAATLTAPTSGPLAGLAVVVDRNNTATQRWVGNGALTVHGAAYAPHPEAALDLRGNGSFTAYGTTVVGDLLLDGQGRARQHLWVHGPQEGTATDPPVEVRLLR